MDTIYRASSKVLRQSIREDAQLVFSGPAAVLSPNKMCVAPAYAAHLSKGNVICRSAEWALCAQFLHRYKCDYNSPLQKRAELEVVRVKWHQGFLQRMSHSFIILWTRLISPNLEVPSIFPFFSKIKRPLQTKFTCLLHLQLPPWWVWLFLSMSESDSLLPLVTDVHNCYIRCILMWWSH